MIALRIRQTTCSIIPNHFGDNHIEMNDEEKDSTVVPEIQIEIEALAAALRCLIMVTLVHLQTISIQI